MFPPNGRQRRFDAAASGPSTTSVLCIDPSPITLLATAGTLHHHGYRCTCAREVAAGRSALEQTAFDALVFDVGDDAAQAWEDLASMREIRSDLPAVLIADVTWAGLERRTEASTVATRCLFKPVDPGVLRDLVSAVLWNPMLESVSRVRGRRPVRRGWVTLD